MMKQPHIILFNPDQWRGDVMGLPGITPHLDQFIANDAISFSNAFCQSPVCTPSRCAFMSGRYPHVRGHRTMFHMLQPDEPMLLRTLKDHGYYVWWGGKNDVVPAQHGYETYCDVKYTAKDIDQRPLRPNFHEDQSWRGKPDSNTYYSFYYGKIENNTGEPYVRDNDWAMLEGAIDLINQYEGDTPLCIYLPLDFPHPPYGVESPWYDVVDRNKLLERIPAPTDWTDKPGILKAIYENQHLFTWTEDQWAELRATYYGMCARVDHQFGLLVEALKNNQMYDDTAIFFFSDHGDFTGDYGLVEKTQNTFEDCLTNVPFVIKPPAHIPVKTGVCDALVELIDLPATVEALTGIQSGHTHFGRSLMPLIRGETDTHRDAVFSQGGRVHGETHCMELEAPDDKDFLYWPRLSIQRQEGPEHTKATMCRTKEYKYVHRLYEQDELYDLQNDPTESHNLIEDFGLINIRMMLKDRLLQFYLETSDVVPHQADERG